MGVIDELNENILHDKNVIAGKKAEVADLSVEIKYYEGHHDGLNTAWPEGEGTKI